MKHPIKKVRPTALPSVGAALVQATGVGKFKPIASRGEYAHLVKGHVVRGRSC